MNSASLPLLIAFAVSLLTSFYVFKRAERYLLNRLFFVFAFSGSLFLLAGFLRMRERAAWGQNDTLTLIAGALFLVNIASFIFLAAVFIQRRSTVIPRLRGVVYHKGCILTGTGLYLAGAMLSRPSESLPPDFAHSAAVGAMGIALGIVLLGCAVGHFGMFRISLGDMADKIAKEMEEALFLVTPELRIVWCNPSAERLSSLTSEAIDGWFIDELLSFGPTLKKGKWLQHMPREGNLANRAGEIIPVSVNAGDLKNKRGAVVGHVVIVRNLTLRRRRVEEIRRHRDELAELVDLKTQELNNSHRSLKRSKAQLSYLNKILMEVKEQESLHIARELHNNIVPALTEIREGATRFADGALPSMPELDYALNKTKKIADLAGAAIQSVERIAAGLPPSALESGDLVSALTELIDDFRGRTGIRCAFESETASTAKRLKEDMAIVVYRVVQESLTNVARHAGGDRIRITYRQDDRSISVGVEDNGRGMNLDTMGTLVSTGIRGMKERARSVRGILDIQSHPGKGTTVRFSADLSQDGVL